MDEMLDEVDMRGEVSATLDGVIEKVEGEATWLRARSFVSDQPDETKFVSHTPVQCTVVAPFISIDSLQ